MELIRKLLGIDKAIEKAISPGFQVQTWNQIYPTWLSWKETQAYRVMDDVYSVVNLISNTAASIPMYAYNLKGEDLPETDNLVKFLEGLSFYEKKVMYTWVFLRGECFIYKDSTLGVNAKTTLHFLNPAFMTIAISDTFPETIAAYRYCDPQRGIDQIFEPEEIVFLKYFNPSEDYVYSWRGLSPISVLVRRLTRLSANMDNSVAQMQNGGMKGVMYFKDLQHTVASKPVIDGVKDNIARFIKNPDNTGAPFITPGEPGWINMGLSLADLQAADLANIDFKKICNAYSVSDRLLNNDATGSEVSDDNARKGLYTNAIMPTATMVQDAFNRHIVPDFGSGKKVKYDYTDVQELQENMKEKADAFAALPVVRPNDVLESFGYERSTDPLMDKYFIKQGYTPIEDVGGPDLIGDEEEQ